MPGPYPDGDGWIARRAAAAMERFGLGWGEVMEIPLGALDMLLRQPERLRYGGLTTGDMEMMERV